MAMGLKNRLTSRQAKYGLNTLLYTLIALAIVVVVNLIANRFVKQIDLTANQRYSLSPQTTKILSELQKDVELLYFDRQPSFDNMRDKLQMYAIQSRRVKVTYVDPDREPAKAQQYNIKTYGTIVVATAERQEQAKGTQEEDITNTIIRVLKGGPKVIYFLTGHGERDIASEERLGFSAAKKALEDSNYKAQTLSLMQQSPKIPPDCSVLIVAGPQKDFLDPEIAAIKEYLMKGGRAFFLVNPLTPPKVAGLLEQFGANIENNVVVDTSGLGRLFGTDELMPLVVQYTDHPVTKDLTNIATLFPFANAIQDSSKGMPGALFQLIAKTTPNSWATKQVRAQQISFRKGEDLEGPLALLGVGTYKSPDSAEAAEGRLVVSGSTELAANAILGFNGNRDLFVNAVNWLASDEDLMSIRPKDPEDRRVNLTPSQMRLIFYISLIGVPLVIVASGLGVWWRRRG